jgi:anti-sigma factor RsiW
MTACFDAATLRAYLDHELDEEEAASVTSHVATCSACEAQLTRLRDTASEAHDHLAAGDLSSRLGEDRALERLRARLEHESGVSAGMVSTRRRPLTRARRLSVLAACVAAALLLMLVFPGGRALAGQLLSVFRAQSVVYVQVPASRVQQLQKLQGQANALFLAKPQPVGTAPTIQTVATLQQATTGVGFTMQAPSALPSGIQSETIQVQGQSVYSMQVNVKTVRQVMQALGVTDVTIPDALGARPITVTLPPVAEIQYQGTGTTLTLIEGMSPTVNLPPGVSLQQLGRAALEVYGMPSDEAAQLSRQIDWNSTLVFPFPQGATDIQQVNVNGAQGVMMQAPSDASSPDAGRRTVVYWQHGARFYIMMGVNMDFEALLLAADSVH